MQSNSQDERECYYILKEIYDSLNVEFLSDLTPPVKTLLKLSESQHNSNYSKRIYLKHMFCLFFNPQLLHNNVDTAQSIFTCLEQLITLIQSPFSVKLEISYAATRYSLKYEFETISVAYQQYAVPFEESKQFFGNLLHNLIGKNIEVKVYQLIQIQTNILLYLQDLYLSSNNPISFEDMCQLLDRKFKPKKLDVGRTLQMIAQYLDLISLSYLARTFSYLNIPFLFEREHGLKHTFSFLDCFQFISNLASIKLRFRHNSISELLVIRLLLKNTQHPRYISTDVGVWLMCFLFTSSDPFSSNLDLIDDNFAELDITGYFIELYASFLQILQKGIITLIKVPRSKLSFIFEKEPYNLKQLIQQNGLKYNADEMLHNIIQLYLQFYEKHKEQPYIVQCGLLQYLISKTQNKIV